MSHLVRQVRRHGRPIAHKLCRRTVPRPCPWTPPLTVINYFWTQKSSGACDSKAYEPYVCDWLKATLPQRSPNSKREPLHTQTHGRSRKGPDRPEDGLAAAQQRRSGATEACAFQPPRPHTCPQLFAARDSPS